MARLPIPGQDSGTWGDVLNDYLSQTLKSDGTIKDNAVTNAAIAPNSITSVEIAPNAITATEVANNSISPSKLITTGIASGTTFLRGDGTWATPPGAGGGISNVVDDPSPQLGGDLDLNSRTVGAATDADLTKLHAITATSTELNYVSGVSSAIQTQLAGKAAAVHTHTASQITDSTTTGRAVVTAADAAAARTAIGAGTSNLVIGTTSTTAKAGDYVPTKSDIGLGNVDNTSDATKNAASATLTNKTISGSNNTLSNIGIGSLTTTGTASSSTFLRGDGSWTAVAGVTSDTPRVIVFSSGWTTRPDSRPVIWLGGTAADTPPGQATGDLWIDNDALNVTLSSLGVTATAAELNTLGGITTTTTELNYVHNVTSSIQTQLNSKRSAAPRVTSIASSATPSVNVDNYDAVSITALAANISSVTISGTPNDFQSLLFRIKDDGTTRTITWGSSFEAGSVALPTATTAGKTLLVGFMYDAVDSKWACEATGSRA